MVVNVPWVDTNTTYSAATSTTLGLVELFSDTVQTTAANAVTTTASRTYGIQVNSSGQMVVNIPWTDTVYTHPSYTAVSQTLTGATVLASFSSDTIGSVTGFTTRTLTAGDIGAAATNQTMHIGTTAVAINRASAALSLTGVSIDGTSSGVVRTVTGTNTAELVRGNMADNDQFRILVGGTASNAGYVEIATADDGTEPIHVRQYTGTFTTLTRTATLLDGSGNTSFPGTLTAASLVRSGGTSSQFLKADGSVDSNSYYLASNPNGYTSNTGTVTNIATGTGLTGGPITGTGTISHSDTSTLNGSYGYVTPDDTGLVVGGISVDGLGHVTDARIYNFRTYTDATYPTKTLQLTIGSTTRDLSASRTWSLSDIGVASATGTGASGTWPISVSGFSAAVGSGEISDLNSAWTVVSNSISNGFYVYRYSNTATNKPVTQNNANWLINIFSHPSGGTASFGHQIAAADTNDIYFRQVTNGFFGSWNRLYHSGVASSAQTRSELGSFVAKGVRVNSGTYFRTIDATNRYALWQAPFSWLTAYYEVGRIITFETTGYVQSDLTTFKTLTIQLGISTSSDYNSSAYGSCILQWGTTTALTNVYVRGTITVTSTSELKLYIEASMWQGSLVINNQISTATITDRNLSTTAFNISVTGIMNNVGTSNTWNQQHTYLTVL